MDGIKDMGKHIKYADTNKRAKLSISKYQFDILKKLALNNQYLYQFNAFSLNAK